MRIAFYVLLLFFPVSSIFAQGSWRKTISYTGGYEFESIDRDQFGNTFCLGTITSGPLGEADLAVSKVNIQGELLWSAAVGDSQIQGGANAVIKTLDSGDIFIAGYSKSSNNSDRDILYALLNSSGDIQWSSSIENLSDHDTPRDIIQLSNGNMFIVGSTNSITFGSSDATVTVIDSEGDLISAYHLGGGSNDHLYSVKELDDGTILGAGNCQSFDGTHHGWIVRFDPLGNILEQNLITTNNFELFMNLEIGEDQSLYLSGFTTQLGNDENPWLVKLSPSLTPEWAGVFGESGIDRATSLDLEGNLVYQISNTESQSIYGNTDVLLDVFDLEGNLVRTDLLLSPASFETQIVTGALNVFSNGSITVCGTEGNLEPQGHLIRYHNPEGEEDCDILPIEIEYTITDIAVVPTSYDQAIMTDYSLVSMSSVPIELEVSNYCDSEIDCSPEYELLINEANCDYEFHTLEVTAEPESFIEWNLSGNISQESSISLPASEDQTVILNIIDLAGCNLDTVLNIEASPNSPPEPASLNITACPNDLDYSNHEQIWDYIEEEEFETLQFISDTSFTSVLSNDCGTAEIILNISVPPTLEDTTINVTSCTNEVLFSDLDIGGYGELLQNTTVYLTTDSTIYLTLESGCSTTVIEAFVELGVIQSDYSLKQHAPCANDTLLVKYFPNQDSFVNEYLLLNDTVITESGTYNLFFTNDLGCEMIEQVALNQTNLIECEACIYGNVFVPNSFSPNNDGRNEIFIPVLNCIPDKYSFQIWSRWGELIFETNEPSIGWVGNVFGGQHYAQIGVYTWQLTLSKDGEHSILKGHVNLIR